MKIIIQILPVVFFFLACSSNPEVKKNKSIELDNGIKIPDSIVSNHTIIVEEDYCYFTSDSENALPVVFIFDPHAKGNVALQKFTNLAIDLKVNIVASLVSKNGMNLEQIAPHVQAVLKSVKSKFPIDSNKIIFAGFSGGGRVASALSQVFPQCMGVVTSGAANPYPVNGHHKFVILCGNKDFNYVECVSNVIQEINNPRVEFFSFPGIHEWPDMKTMKKALGFILYDIKTTKGERLNDNEMNILVTERRQQQELARFFTHKPTTWWFNKLKGLQNKSKENDLEGQSAERLLAYTGMLCYAYTRKAVKSKSKKTFAEHCLEIYEYLEPENPDMMFFKACYFANEGKVNEALVALENSINNGYIDVAGLSSVPQFSDLKNNKQFISLVTIK